MFTAFTGKVRVLGMVVVIAITPTAFAQNTGLEKLIESDLRPWMRQTVVLDAVKSSNAESADLTLEQITAKDVEWRAQVGKSENPLVDSVLNNAVSANAKAKIEAVKGLVTEIIVMNAKGQTVACWPAPSDYYQGDEDQYAMSYGKGAGAVFIGKEKVDVSTQTAQRQVSLSLTNPADGKLIGAVTFGVDLEVFK